MSKWNKASEVSPPKDGRYMTYIRWKTSQGVVGSDVPVVEAEDIGLWCMGRWNYATGLGATAIEVLWWRELPPKPGTELDKAQQPGKVLTDDAMVEIAHREWMRGSENLSYDGARLMEVGALNALRYARDNGYLAPAAGLTAEEAFEVVKTVLDEHGLGVEGNANAVLHNDLRARLTAAIESKIVE